MFCFFMVQSASNVVPCMSIMVPACEYSELLSALHAACTALIMPPSFLGLRERKMSPGLMSGYWVMWCLVVVVILALVINFSVEGIV